jgi:hypothetical protein
MASIQATRVPVQFTDGCAITDSIAYVAAVLDDLDDEVAFSRMFVFNETEPGQWFHHDLNGHRIVSVCLQTQRGAVQRAACALSDQGAVEIANSSQQRIEYVPGAGHGEDSRGLGSLTRIREIAGQLVCCGAGNQVYRREANGWSAIDAALTRQTTQGSKSLVDALMDASSAPDAVDFTALMQLMEGAGGLQDIGGIGDSDLVACGFSGALWARFGTNWQSLNSGTSDHLYGLHAVSDQEIWVCGHNGTLLKGGIRQGFRAVPGVTTTETFWSVRMFDGMVYLGTVRGLYCYDGTTATLVRWPFANTPVIRNLDLTENALWVFTDRFIARLLGTQWVQFKHPDNQ